jgi:hypothetical protein
MKCLRPHDFLDAIVSMGHITKTEDGKYYNTSDGGLFLVRCSLYYIGIIMHFIGKALINDCGHLTTYLNGGEIKPAVKKFSVFYHDTPGSKKYLQTSCRAEFSS